MLKSLNDRALFKLCKKTSQSWYLNRNSRIICYAAYVKKAEIAWLMLATKLETTQTNKLKANSAHGLAYRELTRNNVFQKCCHYNLVGSQTSMTAIYIGQNPTKST